MDVQLILINILFYEFFNFLKKKLKKELNCEFYSNYLEFLDLKYILTFFN